MFLRGLIIVFAICRRHVNDPRAVRRGNKIAGDDIPGFFFDWKETEPAFVFFAGEIASAHGLYGLERLVMQDGQTFLCKDQEFVLKANLNVLDIFSDRESHVRYQCPRSSRPNEEVSIVFAL